MSGMRRRIGGIAQTFVPKTFGDITARDITEKEQAENLKFQGQGALEAGRFAGGVIPDIALFKRLPQIRGAGLAPLLKRSGQAGGIGAFIGGTQLQQPEEDSTRLRDALITGGASAIIPGGARLGQRIFDVFRPSKVLARQFKLDEALKTTEAIKSQRQLKAVGIKGQKAKLSQLTSDEKILKAEAEGAAFNARIARLDDNFQKGRIGIFVKKLLDKVDPRRTGARKTALLIKKEIDSQRNLITTASRRFFGKKLNRAIRITKDKPVVDVSNLRSTLLREDQRISKMALGPEKDAAKEQVVSWLTKIGSGKLSIRHTQQFLQGIGSKAKIPPSFEKQIQQAAESRIDKVIFGGVKEALKKSAKTNEGARLLLDARRVSKLANDRLASINKTNLIQILDNPKRVKTKQVLDFFSNPSTTSDDINIVMPLLSREAQGAVQRQWIQRLVQKSRIAETEAKGANRLSFKKAAENFQIDDRFNAIFPDKVVRSGFVKVKTALRILAQRSGPVQVQSITSTFTEAARNVVSMSGIFIAGLVARRMTPAMLNRALQTAKGRQAIINASKIMQNPKTVPPSVIVLTAKTLKELQEKK